MSLWILLDGGCNMPEKRTIWQRFSLWFGRKLATRHDRVSVGADTLISPQSRIHPRKGIIRIGERCSVAPNAVIQGNVEIGNDCSIQYGTILVGYGTVDNPDGKITIGNKVRIAPYVMMIAGNHVFSDPGKPIHQQGLVHAPITIEDDVWIAGRVNIMAGVTIGSGSVIGAGSVVTKDIPPYSVAVGVPARVVKKRDQVDKQ